MAVKEQMFELLDDGGGPSSWLASFMTQQCTAVFTPLVVLMCLASLFESVKWPLQDAPFSNLDPFLIAGAANLLLAGLVWRFRKRAAHAGKWVWVLPVCLLLIVLVAETVNNLGSPWYGDHPFRKILREFFNPTQKDGFVLIFF